MALNSLIPSSTKPNSAICQLPSISSTGKKNYYSFNSAKFTTLAMHSGFNYHISQPIRCTAIFSLEILEKNNDECILIIVIYWKKTGLLHTKISNHNIIYSS
jgi:hypothetical protein